MSRGVTLDDLEALFERIGVQSLRLNARRDGYQAALNERNGPRVVMHQDRTLGNAVIGALCKLDFDEQVGALAAAQEDVDHA